MNKTMREIAALQFERDIARQVLVLKDDCEHKFTGPLPIIDMMVDFACVGCGGIRSISGNLCD